MKRRTFLPTLFAFFCSLLITVSCAQNTPQANAPAAGTDTAPASAAAGEPVKLGYSSWAGWWPWAIAAEEGLFEKNGANVELIWV
jgi:NitT/TauT family transport system substrate-binding protein